jgi:hypothetical protein
MHIKIEGYIGGPEVDEISVEAEYEDGATAKEYA